MHLAFGPAMHTSTVGIALALLLISPPSLAQQEKAFSDTASVFAVELPVRVLSHGEPIRGLTVEDFEVWDHGQRRDIQDFQVIETRPVLSDGQTEAARSSPASRSEPEAYVFLFDFAYSGSGSLGRALEASRALVERRLPQGSRVTVAIFSAHRGLKVLGPFSDRPADAAAAFDTVAALLARDPRAAARAFTPLAASSSTLASLGASIDDIRREATILVRSDPYWPHRSVIRKLAAGLAALPGLEPTAKGHPTVFLLSHGFDSLYLTGRNSVGTLNQLERVFKRFRQTGWILHAINIGGLRAPNGRETLFLLAHETGGDSYENFNNVGEAFDRFLVKNSTTYILVFHVYDLSATGAYRRLKVRLRNSPRGARVVHRPGYYAPAPFE